MSDRRLRLGFHFYSMAAGGVESHHVALAGELLRRDIDVDFVLVERKGDLLPRLPKGVRIVDLGAKRTLGSILPLANYLRREPPDALFASLGPQNIAAIIARKIARSKVWLGVVQQNALSVQARAGISVQQSLIPLGYRLTLGGANQVLAASSGVADDLAAETGYPRPRIHVLNNAACPSNLDEILAKVPEHRFFGAGVPVLIAVGRLVAQKDFPTLLRAVGQVAAQRPVRLIIVGGGPEEQALRQLADELGIADIVDLVGYQSSPLSWIARSDLFVLSSIYEGFGNVVVEALAMGTPIVSTNCNYGPSEILDGGKYGTLVPVGDPAGLAQGIVQALEADHDRAALQQRARDFSPAVIADAYLAEAFGRSPERPTVAA